MPSRTNQELLHGYKVYAFDNITCEEDLREAIEYYALHGELDDKLLVEYIHAKREEFYEEWNIYSKKYE